MNGRCQKDALDRAEDICELCGEQFCASCLVFPRGHRNPPTCKGCALANSGLRGSGGAKNPISRREYKKRKKELLAQLDGVEEEAPAVDYFQLADPTTFDNATELDRRPPEITEPEPVDLLARHDKTTPPAPGRRADRRAAPAPPPPPPPPPASFPTPSETNPQVDPLPVAEAGALGGFGPVDTSVNPLAIESPEPAAVPIASSPTTAEPVSEASASAAELLARLKADQPIHSQFTSTARALERDPFAQTMPPAAAVAPAEMLSQTSGPPGGRTGPIAPTSDPFATAVPATAAPPAPTRPMTEPWTPPALPPRGGNLDALAGNGATATETTPDPRAPEGRPPQPIPPQPAAPADESPITSADTDTSGQWIPPSLRGIAPPEARAADPLPRRR